jgi:hypothetical protein
MPFTWSCFTSHEKGQRVLYAEPLYKLTTYKFSAEKHCKNEEVLHHISNTTLREASKKKENNLDNLKAEEYTTLSTYKYSRETLKNDEVPHNISNITQWVAHTKKKHKLDNLQAGEYTTLST